MSKSLISPKTYFLIYLALLFLLGISYGVAHVNLGAWNNILGLIFAAVKAFLVGLYFMHLRAPNRLNRLVIGAGLVWFTIWVILILTDYKSRNWLLLPSPWPQNISE